MPVQQRASIDIDLVVERAQLARATDVLRGAGYGLRADATLRGATVIYAAYAQLPFGHLEDPVARDVDLHWRFSNRTLPWNPPLRDLLEAAQPLSVAGVALPIVPLEHELLLQLLHGARHHWRTLEWLLVVRALLRDRSLDANGLLELSRDHVHGCRAVLTGCALAHLLLDTPLPRAIADAVDRRRLLIATQLGLMTSSLALVAIALLPSSPVVLVYVVAFVAGGFGALDGPARSSSTPRLVPRERLAAGDTLSDIAKLRVARTVTRRCKPDANDRIEA